MTNSVMIHYNQIVSQPMSIIFKKKNYESKILKKTKNELEMNF